MDKDRVTHDLAEKYLDEMLEAEENLDFDAFVRRFDSQDIVGFGESRFKKDMYAIREDLGDYQSREYLGSLKCYDNPDRAQKRHGGVRYVWRGVFEKNETLIVVGLHEKDDTAYVYEFSYRH